MAYLRYRWKLVLLGVICVLLFATVFTLYHVPLYALGYAAVLCGVLAAVVAVIDCRIFYNRHRELQALAGEVQLSVDHLPLPGDLLERDYQELIRTLFREKQEVQELSDEQYLDLMEYYTLWAHQIKTPIAAMRLLLNNEGSDSALELRTELQRIEQYVEMVLCYLRLDAGSTDYVLRSYDLDGIVRQAVRKYAGQFIHKKLKLEYEPLNCEVLTDEKWLLFVIDQLLSNALKYTFSGSISITLEPEKTLCIRDTGIGIAAEDLPRVFEKGFTGYNGRGDKRASGIGLYLCKRIMGNLGHGIHIDSVLGEGTTVRLDLRSVQLEVE